MMVPKPTILIVDDEESLRHSLTMALEGKYNVITAKNGKESLSFVRKEAIDLVLLDIRLPEIDGIEVLERIKGIDETIVIIMITAVLTINTAVAAMKKGAYDYITKPFNIDELQSLVEKGLEKRNLLRENIFLRSEILEDAKFEKLVGKSPKIKEVFKVIDEIAKSSSTILIQGESGTGKELVASAIHSRSKRKNKLFVPVNCAAIPENLLESELFGHEKGAFTGAFERHIGKFEMADDGTIFLDEIGSLPLSMQAKLLRTIQERTIERVGGTKPIPVDVRIISATNTDLAQAVKSKRFREDLFYRINVIPLKIPPLRERKEDIHLLIKHFLDVYNREFGKKIKGFKKDAMELLESYYWAGNVRELENLIERLVVLGKDDYIPKEKLPPEILGVKVEEVQDIQLSDLSLKEATERFEAEFIKKALEKAGGSKVKAAKLLGIHRNTLLKLAKKLKE